MNTYEPILKEVVIGLLDTIEIKPKFSNDALVDALLIFQTVLFDKVHDLQVDDKMTLKQGCEMATLCGFEIKKLIHTYTGLDTVELIENYGK